MKKNILNALLFFLAFCTGTAFAQQLPAQPREKVYTFTDQMPVLPGGEIALENYFRNALAGMKFDNRGWIIFSMIIDKTGQAREVEIVMSPYPETDSIILEAVSIIPRWLPGKKDGQPVDVRISIPVPISNVLKEGSNLKTVDSNKTYLIVDERPHFPGGEESLWEFIETNRGRPNDTRDTRKKGLVIVQFKITKTGELQNPEIIKSYTPDSDAEALRLVKSMPNWVPGKLNGQEVNVIVSLPIHFK